jgi:hypothetical protein
MELTQEYLKSILNYNPETGIFTRRRGGKGGAAGNVAGTVLAQGYIGAVINKRRYPVHRLAFLYMTGAFPMYSTDHINGVRTDNRWCNLRDVPQSENNRNVKLKKVNKSGVNGVYWDKARNKWSAQIKCNSKTIALGRFDSFEDAISQRKKAEEKYGYHPNHGRVA